MADVDTRWKQRLPSFNLVFDQLSDAVSLMAARELSPLERQGVIQAFEYTCELGWNVLRDYLRGQGNAELSGSRDTLREAFSAKLIDDGEIWMNMLQDRNRTSHTYNEATATEILNNIQAHYHAMFEKLQSKMNSLANTG
ncbi:MAG: nucleotidyltransferase substrate binding protein [Pseudomonadota bacterium]